MSDFVKQPCNNCPFRRDVIPFLHPTRAVDIAYSAENPHNDFPCHKTVRYTGEEVYNAVDDEFEDVADLSKSKTCAGFLTMRFQMGGKVPDGFEPSFESCYQDEFDMIYAYRDEWNKPKSKI